jgi:hypothetical protein
VSVYMQLEREPKTLRDWTERWNALTDVATVNGTSAERVAAFCERKGISLEALTALGARVATHQQRLCLTFAGWNRDSSSVVALKYRPLDGSSHESRAAEPSTWLRPIIAGKRDALDWFVAEGETDGARLFDLIGDVAAILVLPAGAETFRREWADVIPRGATVYLCHNADEHGDSGAEKIERALAGHTVRLPPPETDWCDWLGTRETFVELVREARQAHTPAFEITDAEAFAAIDEPGADPLVVSEGGCVLPVDGFALVYGDGGAGKTTLCLDWAVHWATGSEWLGVLEPARALRVLVVENEGPRPEFRRKLRRRLDAWNEQGGRLGGRLQVLFEPWAKLNLRDEAHRRLFAEELDGVDIVLAGPLSALGTEGGGTLDQVREFEGFMQSVRDLAARPISFVLVHHENRAGQVSGAWERAPDLFVHVMAEGHGRTRVFWEKVRWCSPLHKTTTHLLWADGDSFTVEEREEITEDTMHEEMLAAVRELSGGSWSRIRPKVRGNDGEKAAVRDRLIQDGTLVNTATREGQFRLWVADDPACPRAELSTALARQPETSRATVPAVGRHGAQHGTGHRGPHPALDDEIRQAAERVS